jgi:hypothetical protein
MKLMMSSVRAARRFRSLKRELDLEIRKTRYRMDNLRSRMEVQKERANRANAADRRSTYIRLHQETQVELDRLEDTYDDLI